jgi:hypothetical protein
MVRSTYEPDAAQAALVRLRCRADAADAAGAHAPASASRPELRCGGCHAIVPLIAPHPHVRCEQCQRALILPARVALRCATCGGGRTIPVAELAQLHACLSCGATLLSGDVVLAARPHHRRSHPRHHRARPSRYGDAVRAVLIVGLALLFALLVLGRMQF